MPDILPQPLNAPEEPGWFARLCRPHVLTVLVLLAQAWAIADWRSEERLTEERVSPTGYYLGRGVRRGWPLTDVERDQNPGQFVGGDSWDRVPHFLNLLLYLSILAATAYVMEGWFRGETGERLSMAEIGVWTFVVAVIVSFGLSNSPLRSACRWAVLDVAWPPAEPSWACLLDPRPYLLLPGLALAIYLVTWRTLLLADAVLLAWETPAMDKAPEIRDESHAAHGRAAG